MSLPSTLPKLELGEARKGLIAGPAGALQYVLEMPGESVRGLAVICHPHPLYQGTMDNKVVYTLSRIAMQAGCAALRFQFRGVGDSEGPHDGGVGEVEDAAWFLGKLRESMPSLPAVMMGFSFGAYMALKVAAEDSQLVGLVTIAPPLAYAGSQPVPQPHCDWIMLHGRADEVVSFEQSRDLAMAMSRPPELIAVVEVDHFFHGNLNILRTTLQPWLAQRLGVASNS